MLKCEIDKQRWLWGSLTQDLPVWEWAVTWSWVWKGLHIWKYDLQRQMQFYNSESVATLMRGKGGGDISSTAPSLSFPYLTSEMEPLALKSLMSKINILPHLTKKATAEQHEIKDHISLNRGLKWHLRERIFLFIMDTCLFRRVILTVKTYAIQLCSYFELWKTPLYL